MMPCTTPGVSPRLAWCDARVHAWARSQCEVLLDGEGPWKLPDGGDDLEIVFTPGHTAGHCVLIHKAQRVRAPPYLKPASKAAIQAA